jgi:hypothetical protein
MKASFGAFAVLVLGWLGSASAAPAADPFAGTWEARVVHGKHEYTLRLRCKTASDCEMQMINPAAKGKDALPVIPFPGAVPQRNLEPSRSALKYALEHRAEGSPNPEFLAIQKMLGASVSAKTEIDQCISLDQSQPEFFMACTIRGATARPVLLFFGSLMGLCGQGFCKHVVYPMVRMS